MARALNELSRLLAGTAGIPARNERFSAKNKSIDSSKGGASNSTRPRTKSSFAPIGAHCGRDARAPRALRVLQLINSPDTHSFGGAGLFGAAQACAPVTFTLRL
jgi:hypothetical protein